MMKKLAITLAIGTALTALPFTADAHNMTTDDLTLILRTWNNGAQATLSPGDRLETAVAPFGEGYVVLDEKYDFLRMVTYRYPGATTSGDTYIARTVKDDNTPANELPVCAVSITGMTVMLKSGLTTGNTYQDFVNAYGKWDSVAGHSDFNWGVNDFPDHGPYYETYYYELPGREFFFTTDNRKPNQPVVQFGYRTEV